MLNIIDSPSHCTEHNSIMVGTNIVSRGTSLSEYVRSWPPSSKWCHYFSFFWCLKSYSRVSLWELMQAEQRVVYSVLDTLMRHCGQFKKQDGNLFLFVLFQDACLLLLGKQRLKDFFLCVVTFLYLVSVLFFYLNSVWDLFSMLFLI